MSAATATPAKKEEKTGLLATVANNARQYGIVGALLVIVVAFEILTGGVLLKPNSFVSLIQQNAYVIILAIGMVMVIIATHIDLSVGSLVAFIGGVCALLMERAGVNWMLAIVIALVVGLIVGVWQGFWVAVIGIPGFITTLAGMLIFRGLATVIVGESVPITSLEFRGIARNYLPNILGWWGPFDGLTIVLGILCIVGFAWSQLRKRARVAKVGLVPEPMSLTVLKIVLVAVVIAFVTYLLASSGNADQGGTPIMLVIVGVLVFIYNFILTKTVFGRHVYAVGGNRKAAILSGINTRRVDFMLFVHMGFLSAVAAVCMLSRLASATAQAGMEFEMDAIAACFIGGTAVTGGIGTIPGAVIGAFVMGVINQGLSIMGVDTAVVKTIKGLVLLLAVAVDIISKRKKSCPSPFSSSMWDSCRCRWCGSHTVICRHSCNQRTFSAMKLTARSTSRMYALTCLACVIWLWQSLVEANNDGSLFNWATIVFSLCLLVVIGWSGWNAVAGWNDKETEAATAGAKDDEGSTDR